MNTKNRFTIDEFLKGECVALHDSDWPTWKEYITSCDVKLTFINPDRYFWIKKHNNTLYMYTGDKHNKPDLPSTTTGILMMDTPLKAKTIAVDIEFVKKAWEVAPNETKRLIEANVNMFAATTTEMFVEEMMEKYKGCKKWGGELRKRYPGLGDRSVEIKKDSTHRYLLDVRNRGEYAEKGFWLNKDYAWEIKTDSVGSLVLVPSLKD